MEPANPILIIIGPYISPGFGGILYDNSSKETPNPSLIIKAPTLVVKIQA